MHETSRTYHSRNRRERGRDRFRDGPEAKKDTPLASSQGSHAENSTKQSEPTPEKNPDVKSESGVSSAPSLTIIERTEKRLPYINIFVPNWRSNHASECRYQCKSENDHYREWRRAYDEHLWDLYSILRDRLNSSKVNFSHFTEFVYLNSSGYISEFV